MAEQKNTMLEQAGKAGLVLGGVSVAYMLITMLTGKLAGNGPAILLGLLNVLLWLAKFVGCIFLMRLFILKFAQSDPTVDSSRAFRFGTLTALLSALIYAGFYMAYTSFIDPDMFSEAIEVLQDNPMFDSNTMSQIEEILPKMPTYAFFGNLIYCWLFGTILAAIFSRSVASSNPFIDEQ